MYQSLSMLVCTICFYDNKRNYLSFVTLRRLVLVCRTNGSFACFQSRLIESDLKWFKTTVLYINSFILPVVNKICWSDGLGLLFPRTPNVTGYPTRRLDHAVWLSSKPIINLKWDLQSQAPRAEGFAFRGSTGSSGCCCKPVFSPPVIIYWLY